RARRVGPQRVVILREARFGEGIAAHGPRYVLRIVLEEQGSLSDRWQANEQGRRMSQRGIFDLTGKVAIVGGGASGIGEAVTLGAASSGARVVCLDIKEQAAEAVATRATQISGVACEAGVLDIRDGAAVARSFDEVHARFGTLDIVICTPSINVRKPIMR